MRKGYRCAFLFKSTQELSGYRQQYMNKKSINIKPNCQEKSKRRSEQIVSLTIDQGVNL